MAYPIGLAEVRAAYLRDNCSLLLVKDLEGQLDRVMDDITKQDARVQNKVISYLCLSKDPTQKSKKHVVMIL
jgi:hypothetical protein